MRFIFSVLLSLGLIANANAMWQKINETDYKWGPFKIYHIALFSESGEYAPDLRPLMLTLTYDKPVDGRDFAISIARSWANLEIKLPEQDKLIEHLRKTLPNLKPQDSLSYIALQDKGYFVHNDEVLPEEFNAEFNQAMLAIWLDSRVELSHILTKKADPIAATLDAVDPLAEMQTDDVENRDQAVTSELKNAPVERVLPENAPEKTPDDELQNPEQEIKPISDPPLENSPKAA